jgi:AcrR family transcriptional regulator
MLPPVAKAMRRNKKEQILKIAAALIAREGFSKTSFQRIADRAGLHKSSLFHYLRNKEEVLLGILEKSIDEVNLKLESIIRDSSFIPKIDWGLVEIRGQG